MGIAISWPDDHNPTPRPLTVKVGETLLPETAAVQFTRTPGRSHLNAAFARLPIDCPGDGYPQDPHLATSVPLSTGFPAERVNCTRSCGVAGKFAQAMIGSLNRSDGWSTRCVAGSARRELTNRFETLTNR
ncbi:MAG: hypothetical protein DWQ29_11770 [Planctomycetota bacterium]|nr:MAG: hypothetical protein DWQ29_11770 [Planctomycetota bacterium]